MGSAPDGSDGRDAIRPDTTTGPRAQTQKDGQPPARKRAKKKFYGDDSDATDGTAAAEVLRATNPQPVKLIPLKWQIRRAEVR